MRRRTAALLALALFLPVTVAIAGGRPLGASARGFVAPTAMQTVLARRFPTATPVTPGPTDPAIDIIRVDLLHRIHGVFSPTRRIRVGNLARYVVYFHQRNAGSLLPRCHITFFNSGHEFYEDAMWRKRGKNRFFLDGRFRNVLGPTTASFTIYLGRSQDSASLTFSIRLPKL